MHLISILLLSFSFNTTPIADTGIHHYYYMWSGNHSPEVSAWGEDDFDCDHKPTKVELLKRVRRMFSKTDQAYKYLKIQDIIYFENEDAFFKWKMGQDSPQKAYQIYLHQ